MIEILHGLKYQNHEDLGSIVYMGSCRILLHQQYWYLLQLREKKSPCFRRTVEQGSSYPELANAPS